MLSLALLSACYEIRIRPNEYQIVIECLRGEKVMGVAIRSCDLWRPGAWDLAWEALVKLHNKTYPDEPLPLHAPR